MVVAQVFVIGYKRHNGGKGISAGFFDLFYKMLEVVFLDHFVETFDKRISAKIADVLLKHFIPPF